VPQQYFEDHGRRCITLPSEKKLYLQTARAKFLITMIYEAGLAVFMFAKDSEID
jgi:hypothetical protein